MGRGGGGSGFGLHRLLSRQALGLVCVCVWVTFEDVFSCEMAWRGLGVVVGVGVAACQYQITGRSSAGTHGATEQAEALQRTGGNENLLQAN